MINQKIMVGDKTYIYIMYCIINVFFFLFFMASFPPSQQTKYNNNNNNNNNNNIVLTENFTLNYALALFSDLGEYDNPIRYDYNQGRQKTTAGIMIIISIYLSYI